MGNASYDTLTITINADSKQANSSISRLSSNLEKLDKTAKNINTRRIGEVKGLLLNIAKIDFSNVSKGLQDIVSAFKAFQSKAFMKTATNAVNLTPIDPSKLKLDDNSKDLAKVEANLQPIVPILDNIKAKTDSVTKAFQDTTKPIKKLDNNIKKLTKDTEILGKKGGASVRSLGKQFKNILKYRIIRKIIQEIYKAFTSGLTNIANFDSNTKETLANIKASLGYIVNSVGSMLAPLLQMIQPLITSIGDAVGDIANTLGEVFAGLNGQTEFAKAKKDVDAYRKTLEKTQSVGIDELNVLNQDTGSFEYVTVEQVEGTSKIKELISFIGDVVKDLNANLTPMLKDLLEPIMQIISTIVGLVKQLIGATFQKVHQSLASFTKMISKILSFVSEIISGIANVLEPVMEIIGTVVNIINEALSSIFDAIGGIFDILKPIINIINGVLVPVLKFIFTIVSTIFYVLEAIINTIVHILTFQWGKIGGDWNIGGKIKASWDKMGTASYASGGFPEDGFFFANHNELVGTFDNGKTAVANNEQITEGIYRAVKEAMIESNRGGVEITLDGYDVTKSVTRRQDNMSSFLKGGNLAYGK